MATLKEFEAALREYGMASALALLETLRQRDRAKRVIAAPRRVAGRKMTPELARNVLELHRTTKLTQQEIAFKLGVNRGRVNEVINHGKWLSEAPNPDEAPARDGALRRARPPSRARLPERSRPAGRVRRDQSQLALGDF